MTSKEKFDILIPVIWHFTYKTQFSILGRFTYASDDIREYLEKNNCIAIRYVDDNNNATERYPYNPNGSKGNYDPLFIILKSWYYTEYSSARFPANSQQTP